MTTYARTALHESLAYAPCMIASLPGNSQVTGHEPESFFGLRETTLAEDGQCASAAYRCIHNELAQDGNPRLNLGTFGTTWMENEAGRLAGESINKNLINVAEYPGTDAIHSRVVEMIAELFHADRDDTSGGFRGTTTAGSSEAVMLALLTHKWNWKKRQRRNPRASAKDRPFIVIGTGAHACFSKFARYFDTGVKWVPIQPGQYAVTAEQVRAVLDTDIESDHEVMRECGYLPEEVRGRKMAELVLVVGCVVCTTYTGDMDDVAGIDRVLTEGGWDIPIHVDAASGGFVLPFSREDLKWDFRLAHVQSINTSNHKYGLVYPGLGTLVFRHRAVVPEELIVDIDYLSGESRNFSLNFSRPSAGVVLQYYNFLRLGRSGYRRLIARCLDTTAFLAHEFRTLPTLGRHLERVTRTDLFPVLAFRIRQSESECAPFTLTELANALREKRGWIVPVYRLPANTERIEVMRVVVRAEMTLDLAKLFLDDLMSAIGFFEGAAHV